MASSNSLKFSYTQTKGILISHLVWLIQFGIKSPCLSTVEAFPITSI